MRYFAGSGKLSTTAFDGGIEVSEALYNELLGAVLAGHSVVIMDGQPVATVPETPEPPPPAPPLTREEWRPTANRSPARLIPALVERDWITTEEAEAWLEGRGLPALALSLMAGMPPMQALKTKAFLLRMLRADRMDPITLGLAEAKRQVMDPQPTPEEMAELVDELFGWEAQP